MDYEPGSEPHMTLYLGIDHETGDFEPHGEAYRHGPGHSFIRMNNPRIAFAVEVWLDAEGKPHAEISNEVGYLRP